MDNLSTIKDVCDQLRLADQLLPETSITKSEFYLVEQVGRLLIRAVELNAFQGEKHAEFRLRAAAAANDPGRLALESPTALNLDVTPYEERLEQPPAIQDNFVSILETAAAGYAEISVPKATAPVSNLYERLKQGLPQLLKMLATDHKKPKRGDELTRKESIDFAWFEAARGALDQPTYKPTYKEMWDWIQKKIRKDNVADERRPTTLESFKKNVQRVQVKTGRNIAAKNQK